MAVGMINSIRTHADVVLASAKIEDDQTLLFGDDEDGSIEYCE